MLETMQEREVNLLTKPKGLQTSPDQDAHHLLSAQEELLFYHRAHIAPSVLRPVLIDNEVLVTSSRVVVTESLISRIDFQKLGFGSNACDSWKQQSFDRDVVRGYEAKRMVPKFKQLVLPLLGLAWCVYTFWGPENIVDVIHSIVLLIPFEHVIWAFGGTCSKLPNCRQMLAQPLQSGSVAFGELLRAKKSAVSLIESHGNQTAWMDLDQKKKSRVQSRSGLKLRKLRRAVEPDGCKDFQPWHDLDGNDCQRYAEPGWLLSCHDLTITPDRMEEWSERRDAGLKLSPIDACCACGGSEPKARARGISMLAKGVYDALLSLDNSEELENKIPARVVALIKKVIAGGEATLLIGLMNITNAKLVWAGSLAGSSSAHIYFSNPEDVVPALELVQELFPSASAVAAAAAVAANPPPAVQNKLREIQMQMIGIWRDVHGGVLQVSHSVVHFLRIASCLWRIYFVVLTCVCLSVLAWWFDLLRRPTTYVVLRCHDKYFGEQKQMEPHEIIMQSRFRSEFEVGFFLPTERVNEFAASLRGGGASQV